MNVYDFDGTIYRGDSSVDFYWFCVRTRPAVLSSIPPFLVASLRHVLGQIDRTTLKEVYFSFLVRLMDVESLVSTFWERNLHKIEPWYLDQKRADDVVISASPEFLLKPAGDKLGVRVIASRVDPATGMFDGQNCRGSEKVRRFREEFLDTPIAEFYSDSKSDEPLALLSSSAFLVKNRTIKKWNYHG